jgi:subtilisin family serine protease
VRGLELAINQRALRKKTQGMRFKKHMNFNSTGATVKFRPRTLENIAVIVAALSMAVFFYAPVAAEERDFNFAEQAAITSLNTVLNEAFGDASPGSLKAGVALIDRVYESGSVPVIVRLRDKDLPYGLFSDVQKSRSATIAALQGMVLDDMGVNTAGDQARLNIKRFSMIPAMAMQVTVEALEALLDHPNVIDIVEDVPIPPALDTSVPLIGGEFDGTFSTYTGSGQAVAILDTGVDKNHPFLQGKVVSEACYSSNVPTSGATSLCPGGVTESTAVNSALNCDTSEVAICSHGTHVAGIAAGKGESFSGVAKDASIIAIQVFSLFNDPARCGDDGPCVLSYTSDQIKGLERVYALRNTYAIASANMSLSGGAYAEPCNSAQHKPIIDSLRAAGIATVAASGDSGNTHAIGVPACVDSAVSVGSTSGSDEISYFTNSAYFLSLLAPGSSITSSVPAGGYQSMSGTSMAAPHVAGAWAVLKQARPDASVDEVLDALQDTGIPVTDTRDEADSRVKPRIDVQGALQELNACDTSAECDDGIFCNGVETCSDGACAAGRLPCGGSLPVCDETNERCVECFTSADCNDGVFCNGVETCSGTTCAAGTVACGGDTPGCDETDDRCVECTDSYDCESGSACLANICIEAGELNVVQKALFSSKLVKKGKKLKLTITGDEAFNLYGSIDPGPFTLVKAKPNMKKGRLKVSLRVPAGFAVGSYEIWVGNSRGFVTIR